MSSSERVFLITGAGSGIGAVIAARAAAGANRVIVADIDGDAAERVATELAGAVAIELDVADRGAVRQVVDEVAERWGHVEVLVNNAAVASDIPFTRLPAEVWHRDLAVSLDGAFHTIQATLPAMMAARAGVIVNIGSVNGLSYLGNEAYSAAKAALFSLTKSIAVRYGRYGIRCNAVAPGTIATPIWRQRVAADPDIFRRVSQWYPLGRVGTPEDVADAVMFLAGDQSSWITGVTLPVDGGLLAGNIRMAEEITIAENDT